MSEPQRLRFEHGGDVGFPWAVMRAAGGSYDFQELVYVLRGGVHVIGERPYPMLRRGSESP